MQVLVVRHYDMTDKHLLIATASYLGLKHLPTVLAGSGYLFFMDAEHIQRMNDLNITNFNP